MRLLLGCAALLAVLAASGCVAAGAQNPANFRAADVAPPDAWLFAVTTTRPSPTQLLGVRAIQNAFTSQPGWDAAVNTLSQNASGGAGAAGQRVDLQRDVLPLLSGEVAFAYYGAPGSDPKALTLVESSNAERLARLGAPANATSRTYRDTTIVEYSTGQSRTVAAAYKGWAIFGQEAAAVERTIDRLGSGTGGLGQQARFRAAAERLPRDKIGLWYVDPAPLLRDSLATAQNIESLPPEVVASLQTEIPSTAISVSATTEGLDLRLEASGAQPAQEVVMGGDGDALAGFGHLPASTLLAVSGAVPPEAFAVLNAVTTSALEAADSPVPAPDIHPEDWLTGELAVGISSGSLRPGFLRPGGMPSFYLVAGVANPAAARRDLAAIERLFPPKSVVPVDVAGALLRQVATQPDLTLTYGVADDWLYATNGDAEALVAAAAVGGLEDNPRYAALRTALGGDQVNTFVDLEGVREVVTGLLGPSERAAYRTTLAPLVAPLVLVTVVSALFFGDVRFREAADVSLVLLAAAALPGTLAGGGASAPRRAEQAPASPAG
jgi:hypothetical protein